MPRSAAASPQTSTGCRRRGPRRRCARSPPARAGDRGAPAGREAVDAQRRRGQVVRADAQERRRARRSRGASATAAGVSIIAPSEPVPRACARGRARAALRRPRAARRPRPSAAGCAAGTSAPSARIARELVLQRGRMAQQQRDARGCRRLAGEERRQLVAAEVEHSHRRHAAGQRRQHAGAARAGARPRSASRAASRNSSSVRSRPTPSAPASSAARTSAALATLASTVSALAVAGDGGQERASIAALARGGRAPRSRPGRRPARRPPGRGPRARVAVDDAAACPCASAQQRPARRRSPSAVPSERATIAAWAVGPPAASAMPRAQPWTSATSAGPRSSRDRDAAGRAARRRPRAGGQPRGAASEGAHVVGAGGEQLVGQRRQQRGVGVRGGEDRRHGRPRRPRAPPARPPRPAPGRAAISAPVSTISASALGRPRPAGAPSSSSSSAAACERAGGEQRRRRAAARAATGPPRPRSARPARARSRPPRRGRRPGRAGRARRIVSLLARRRARARA